MKKGYLTAEGKQGRTIVARLKPRQEVITALNEIISQHGIKAGYIPTLLGGFKNVKIISPKPSDDEDKPIDIETEYRQPLEYFGTGTIAQQNGKPSIHIHLTVGGAEAKATVGHLVSGEVVFVTEVVIVELTNVTMERKEDPEVFDLPLLDFA